ncbi:MAG TPA: glycosyltransferase family 4 protein [Ilumatobacteraceae bacterium]|nr:glycosyltransferase family 4 protein [Ilumatobacteraceae bacterium]
MTAERRRVLLTVSGTIPADLNDQIARGDRPRPDYLVMAEALGAELVDHVRARETTGRLGRLVERIAGPNVLLAWSCFRQRRHFEVVFTDGEQVGIPYAAMTRFAGRRGARHIMIVHILTVRKKMALMRALRLASRIDRMVVYSSRQRDLIATALSYPPDHIVLSPFMVDTTFFAPDAVDTPARRMICSAGLEFRDYPTMVEAVRGLDVEVVLAAASPWSKRRDVSGDVEVPANVTVDRFGFADLRALYASAEFVVVPLVDTDFQAGITTILEAMAMGKAVICSRTRGQVDVIVDGSTGIYVRPGDAAALHTAIANLLDDHDLAARLGRAAREWAVAEADIQTYADEMAGVVDAVARMIRS